MIWQPLRRRAAWLTGGALLLLVIVVGSLLPGPVVEVVPVSDKLEHVAGYAALTLWWLGLVERRGWWAVVLAAVAVGAGIELLQDRLTATRLMDPTDMLANSLGAGLAWLAAAAGLGDWAHRVERWLGQR